VTHGPVWLFALALALATALAVLGRTRGPLWLHYATKPLIVAPLVAGVVVLPSRLPPAAHGWLLTALLLCWVGDVALMFGRRAFYLGLGAFLLAHVAYLVCFSVELPWRWQQLPWLLPVLPLTYLGMRGVLPYVGRLRPAVLAYASALSLLAWRLFARWSELGWRGWLIGAVGAVLFVLGDSLLARRRFASAPAPYWLELGAYGAAQACIVASTL
jgi:alkenylglycerophosphocholine/alkenylglycerophosphoethanolamine hydrolase